MQSFDFQHRTRFVFGPGVLGRLGDLAGEVLGISHSQKSTAKRVLVVSDPGVVSAGHFARGRDVLVKSGFIVESFHGLKENPSTEQVNAGVAFAKEFQPDLLVGLGGGSSIDCAKGINFVYSCGGRMQDYWGVGKATGDLLPMIAVPTTAGTGSEAQSFALISDAETHVKMACGDPRAACRVALLDPELTVTQPPQVTALTAIDAVTHALETFVTKKRNPLSMCYSREAWRLLSSGLPMVLQDGSNVEARGQVQLGACFAGMAIETSMLGAAHALANPLTARYGITHGQAVGLMMPHVIRFNGQEFAQWYTELWQLTEQGQLAESDANGSVDRLAELVETLVRSSGLETRLESLGVSTDDVTQLAGDATQQWTGTFNPRELNQQNLETIYKSAF
jgi:alcohol dehydrogenase